jgi:hypothetical protein
MPSLREREHPIAWQLLDARRITLDSAAQRQERQTEEEWAKETERDRYDLPAVAQHVAVGLAQQADAALNHSRFHARPQQIGVTRHCAGFCFARKGTLSNSASSFQPLSTRTSVEDVESTCRGSGAARRAQPPSSSGRSADWYADAIDRASSATSFSKGSRSYAVSARSGGGTGASGKKRSSSPSAGCSQRASR